MFYAEMAAVAAELLQEFGQSVTLTRYTQSYDTSTGANTTHGTDYAAWGAAFAVNGREIDGVRVLDGDMRVLLERSQTVPEVGDSVQVNGSAWRVVAVEAVSPAGYDVIYKLQVRQ